MKQQAVCTEHVEPCMLRGAVGGEFGEVGQTDPVRFGSLPVESELDPLGNVKSLEACKKHEQIYKSETQECSSVSGEVPYVQLISRIRFSVKNV